MKSILSTVALLGAVAFLGGCNSGGSYSQPAYPSSSGTTYTAPSSGGTYTPPASTAPSGGYTAPAAPSGGGTGAACGAGGKNCGGK